VLAGRVEAEGDGTKVLARVWLGWVGAAGSSSWADKAPAFTTAPNTGKAIQGSRKEPLLSTPVVMPDFFTVKRVNSYQ